MAAGTMDQSSDGQWQQRVIVASRSYIGLDSSFPESYAKDPTNDLVELFGPIIDNSSYQCPGFAAEDGFCVPCPDDKPLWWLVLRWLKMMPLKIARSYHAKPLFLVVAPLIVGIGIGYWLGTRRSRAKTKESAQTLTQASSLSKIWINLRDFALLLCFRLSSLQSRPVMADQEHRIDPPKPFEETSTCMRDCAGMSAAGLKEEHRVRTNLKSDEGMTRESGVDVSQVPRHVAVIMDGNRRYGKAKYGNASKGHWDGSSKLVEFAKWCIAEDVSVLSVYAFSTENWNRDPAEVASLMTIFSNYCNELRMEALKRNIKILVLSTDTTRIPAHVKDGLERMTRETEGCTGLTMNICMSYGSRGEILNATRSIAGDVADGKLGLNRIDEREFEKRLLTSHCGDPDVLLRTSGEVRISNYMLWQLAYCEMFFLEKPWPAVEKADLLEVIRMYAKGRIRRYGK